MGGGHVQHEGAAKKNSSKILDIVSCALKVSIDGVISSHQTHLKFV